MFEELTEHLAAGHDLDEGQVCSALTGLMHETDTPEAKAAFLTALAKKGESVDEIAVFARELRERATAVPVSDRLRQGEILDVCGTGGDKLNTFNISTTVAILCAAAGVTVAKHGNRAITSKSGSADVLKALGIPTELSPEEAAANLETKGFAFLFALGYHPAFKHIMPARKLCAEQGQRTIFNFLGPLLNPARPSAQIVGVPNPSLCEPLARVLQALGVRRGMVVCGEIAGTEQRMDEFSTLGETTIAEFYQEKGFSVTRLSPADFPIQPVTLADLAGGDAEENAETTRKILQGADTGPRAEAVLLNAGAALFVAGRAGSIGEGFDAAREVITDGRAAAKLAELAA